MFRELPPTISIDGAAIRRIREEKKLTQLYVAKVVGVTTDTISRWENNRYPTIKRENVLRLGEALEVPVEQILQPDSEIAEILPAESSPAVTGLRLRLLTAVAASGLLVVVALMLWNRNQPVPVPSPPLKAQRSLAVHGAPGSIVPVLVRLDVSGETKGYILREHFPPGWKLIEASPPASSLDNEEGTARWIVKPGEPRPVVIYLVRIDPRAQLGSEVRFRGEVVANTEGQGGSPITVGGDGTVKVVPYLWADLDGDGSISDAEMLDASDVVDDMAGVHIDWKQLESLWDAGRYRWDGEKLQFVAVRAHSPPLPRLRHE